MPQCGCLPLTPCCRRDSHLRCGPPLSPPVSGPCQFLGLYPIISGCLSSHTCLLDMYRYVTLTLHCGTGHLPPCVCPRPWPEPGALSALRPLLSLCRTIDDRHRHGDTYLYLCVSPTAVGVCLPGTLGSPSSGCMRTSSPSLSSMSVLLGCVCLSLSSLATKLACWWRAAICLHTIGGP